MVSRAVRRMEVMQGQVKMGEDDETELRFQVATFTRDVTQHVGWPATICPFQDQQVAVHR